MKYGPLSEQVERLVASVDDLDADKIWLIARAYEARKRPTPNWSLKAANRAGRAGETHEAQKDMFVSVHARGIASEFDERDIGLVAHAAGNAGVALATEDLIGTMGYYTREYAALVEPWFAGFPPTERENV